MAKCTAADSAREQSGHRTEGVAADVVDVDFDPAERSEDPRGLPRGVADAVDVGDRSADVDALGRFAAQRAARAGEHRYIVAAVNECGRYLVLLAFGPTRARRDPRPEARMERVRDETNVWGHTVWVVGAGE